MNNGSVYFVKKIWMDLVYLQRKSNVLSKERLCTAKIIIELEEFLEQNAKCAYCLWKSEKNELCWKGFDMTDKPCVHWHP